MQYFENGLLNREIQAVAQEGARNHGLLNIGIDDFFNTYIIVPPLPEQQKIAEILSAQDKLISLQEKKIEKLKELKKAYLQKMFPKKESKYPEIRFDGFTDAWEQRKLGDCVEFLDTMRKPLKEGDREKGQYPYYGASGIVDYVSDYIFDAQAFYGVVSAILDEVISLPGSRDKIADLSADITDIIKEYSKVDWTSNTDIHKKISHALDDLLYDYSDNNCWDLSFDIMDKIIDNVKTIALRRF